MFRDAETLGGKRWTHTHVQRRLKEIVDVLPVCVVCMSVLSVCVRGGCRWRALSLHLSVAAGVLPNGHFFGHMPGSMNAGPWNVVSFHI